MSILNQIAIIFGVSLLGEIAAYILPFTFPSQIIALIILFVLLMTGVLKIEHIKEKSDFLLKNMAFFFIPAGVGILDEVKEIWPVFWKLIFIMVSGNFVAFFFSALFCTLAMKLTGRRESR